MCCFQLTNIDCCQKPACALLHLSLHTHPYRNACVPCEMGEEHSGIQTHRPYYPWDTVLAACPRSWVRVPICYKTSNLLDKSREGLEYAQRLFPAISDFSSSLGHKTCPESQVKPPLIAIGLLKVLAGPCLQLAIKEAFCCPTDSLLSCSLGWRIFCGEQILSCVFFVSYQSEYSNWFWYNRHHSPRGIKWNCGKSKDLEV